MTMDCCCCFPCFGICKKSRRDDDVIAGEEDPRSGMGEMGEREPLLPKDRQTGPGSGSRRRYTASDPNSATGTTPSKKSGSDTFRDQISDIVVALNAGKVPSQTQITGALRGLLSSGVLNMQAQSESDSEPSKDLNSPESARARLTGDVQEMVEALLNFGVEKNGDDKLQEIYSNFTSLMPHIQYKPSGRREDVSFRAEISTEVGFDTMTLLSALRTLALAALASPSCRHILGHLASIIAHHVPADDKDVNPTSEKETIVIAIQEIIDRIRADHGSRCAMRAILILVRKYAHALPVTDIGETSPTPLNGNESEIADRIDIPQPAIGLLKNIKEVLERCAGGKSLDGVLSALVSVMHDLSEKEEAKSEKEDKNEASRSIHEETAKKIVETPKGGEHMAEHFSSSTPAHVPGFRPTTADDTAVKIAATPPKPTPQPSENSKPSASNGSNGKGNGNGNGMGENQKKKTSSRNRKKNQKAKIKRRQKALEKRAQESKNGSPYDPAEMELPQNGSDDKGEDESTGTGASTSIQPMNMMTLGTEPGLYSDMKPQVSETAHSSSTPTFQREVTLSAFFTRLGHFIDNLLSETECEHAHASDIHSPAGSKRQEKGGIHAEEGQRNGESSTAFPAVPNSAELESLVNDALRLFVDRATHKEADKGDSQSQPPIHTLLVEVRHFTHALENDWTVARLCKAADKLRHDAHLAWGLETSSGVKRLLLKHMLRALPLPLPLPLARTSLSTRGPQSRIGINMTSIADVQLKMGNWEGVLTDLWVSGNSDSGPSMLTGVERSRNGWKWLMEGARVVEARLVEGFQVGADDDEDDNADEYDNDDNNNDDNETTTLLSSTRKANKPIKNKNHRRSKSKSTIRTSHTQTSYTSSDGTIRAASSSHQPDVPVPPPKSQRTMRLRMRIQVPLSDPGHRHPLHLRAGIENARYRVSYAGPCSTLVGYEDDGVLDAEFGVGRLGTDGEVEIEVNVDLGFEEGEGPVSDTDNSNKDKENKKDSMMSLRPKSASTLSLCDPSAPISVSASAPAPFSPDRVSSHISLPLSPSEEYTAASGAKSSPIIPEIVVHDYSEDEDQSEVNANVMRDEQGKPKSLKVLSITVVPQKHLAMRNQEEIEIDITRQESTGHHWATTDMFILPLGGSRGELVEQMVRFAVNSWVRGIVEDLVRDAVEEWLTGFVGGCERVWETAEKIFGGDGIFWGSENE